MEHFVFAFCSTRGPCPQNPEGDTEVQAQLRQEIADLKAQLKASEDEKQSLSDQNGELEQDVQRLQAETAQLQAMVRAF